MQTVMAIVDFADHQLKKRPLVGRQNAIAQFMPPFFQRDALFFRGKRAQIVTRDVILRRCRQDSLLPVGINHHTQHIVACDELVPCFLQYGEIELIVAFIPLKQDVTGDAAIANEVGSPQPVGVLNGRQREGRITLVGVVPQHFRLRSGRRRLWLRTDKLRESMRRQILPRPFRIDAYAQVVLNIATEFKEEQRVHAELQQILVLDAVTPDRSALAEPQSAFQPCHHRCFIAQAAVKGVVISRRNDRRCGFFCGADVKQSLL